MSIDPEGMPAVLRQQELTRQLGRALWAQLPQPDEQIVYTRRRAGGAVEEHAVPHTGGVARDEVLVPPEVSGLAEELRAVSAHPEGGTWFTMTVTVTSTGSMGVDYDYDGEPAWTIPVAAQVYADDLQYYPRTVENRPEWLRGKLADG